jgi:hypothetical protein
MSFQKWLPLKYGHSPWKPGADQRGNREVGGELVVHAAGRPGGVGGGYQGSGEGRTNCAVRECRDENLIDGIPREREELKREIK